MTSARAIAIAAAFMLAACAPEFNPPADYVGGFLWDNNKSRIVSVKSGDTLYAISRRYDVPTKAIIARNNLQEPYQLMVGQELFLDPARSHQIQAGDTLSKIARQYGVEMRLIAEANDLIAPFVIKIGQELWIPDPFSIAAAPIDETITMAEAPPARAAPAKAPIAREDLTPPPGAEPAPMSRPISQQPLSGPVQTQPQTQPQTQSQTQSQPQPQAQPGMQAARPATVERAESVPPPPASETPAPQPTPSSAPPERQIAIAEEDPKPLTKPAPRVASRFIWPLGAGTRGTVIAGFGPAGKGLHNDGINIAAPDGAKVRAADNGVVAYSGNELKGFGNLLLIKHADGWTTAYAHNGLLLVKRGDVVKQGQDIATVGRTGNVQVPQLHFEVRKGTQAVDPLIHLERPTG